MQGGTVSLGTVKFDLSDLIPDMTDDRVEQFLIETTRKILDKIYGARKIPSAETIKEFFNSFSELDYGNEADFVQLAKFLDDAATDGGIESTIRARLVAQGVRITGAVPPATPPPRKGKNPPPPSPGSLVDANHDIRFADPQVISSLKSAAESVRKTALEAPMTIDSLVHRMLLLGRARTALGRTAAYSLSGISTALAGLGLLSAGSMTDGDIYVEEDEAKSLITDAVIRTAAVKSLERFIARWYKTFTEFNVGTADNNLLTLFRTPAPDVCDTGLWGSTISSYNIVVSTVDPDDYDQFMGVTTGGESAP
jgi:hypothetical protein